MRHERLRHGLVRGLGHRLGRRDHGSAIVEFITIGLVLLLPLIYVMITVFSVQKAAYAVSAASRAGGRAYVLAGSDGQNATGAMTAAVDMALADQGVRQEALPPEVSCVGGCLQPGSSVRVTVVVNVPLPLPDFMSGWASRSITVRSTNITPYGGYRAGR